MMKHYWKKMVAFTCGVAMLSVMAGCGATNQGETAQSSASADGSKEITITFAEHVADIKAQEPHLDKIITAFEESHPGIKRKGVCTKWIFIRFDRCIEPVWN